MAWRGWIHQAHQRPAAAAGRAVAGDLESLDPSDPQQRQQQHRNGNTGRGHHRGDHCYVGTCGVHDSGWGLDSRRCAPERVICGKVGGQAPLMG